MWGMKFKYKKYGPHLLRPVIPITLIAETHSVGYEALVDSGADFCIFPSQLAEILEIDITRSVKKIVSGITGVKEYYYTHAITLSVGGWSYDIKAGFLPNIAELGYGVVGQRGFFDLFIVKFDLLKEEIELKQR